ncbi:MAG: hypothetical protein RLZZ387_2563 [Chloroflexota bacterium]|jgi:CHAD domain-containing protein
MPLAEVARQQLRHVFEKLLACEEGARIGEDSESVHRMRVATRRLRTWLQVVEGVYEHTVIRRYRRGLGHIARVLGAVRDADVLLAHIIAYRDALPRDQRAVVTPLVAAVAAEREHVRQEFLDVLRSGRYQRFTQAFATFVSTPSSGVLPSPEPGVTQRVCDFAGSAIWRRYELWRAYETALTGADDELLHAARIAGKHLRYTLELFAETLGPNVTPLLEPLAALQDTLGALQDSVTAHVQIAALGLAGDPATQTYLAARSTEHAVQRAELPLQWQMVASAAYRQQLLGALLTLHERPHR